VLTLIRITLYVFIAIIAATALLVLAGLGRLWFFPSQAPEASLPYLQYLLGILMAEVISVVLMLARKGAKYLPHAETHKTETKTFAFMKSFLTNGSTVQIVSSRLTWIRNAPDLFEEIERKAQEGTLVEIITPEIVTDEIRTPLASAGVRFYVTGEDVPPEARFTLINGNRSGAERLAIARGSHPEHEVTVFDSNSGPQIIGMAKDIIRKSKGLADAREMGQNS
jgi:hypothetical protein